MKHLTLFDALNRYQKIDCYNSNGDGLVLHAGTTHISARRLPGIYVKRPSEHIFKGRLGERSLGEIDSYDDWLTTYDATMEYAQQHGFPDDWEGRIAHEQYDKGQLYKEWRKDGREIPAGNVIKRDSDD